MAREKCAQANIHKMLKMQSYDFYKKVINTQQQYKDKKYRNEKYKKYFKLYKYSNKRKFLGKSRTYKNRKWDNKYVKEPSKSKFTSFIYGDPKHLINACLTKEKINSKIVSILYIT